VNVRNPHHGVAQGARHQIRDATRRTSFFECNAKHLAPWDENGRNRDEDPDKEHKGSQKPIWLGALKEAKNRMAFNPGGEQSKQKHRAAARNDHEPVKRSDEIDQNLKRTNLGRAFCAQLRDSAPDKTGGKPEASERVQKLQRGDESRCFKTKAAIVQYLVE